MCQLSELKQTTAMFSAVNYFLYTHQHSLIFGEINDQKDEDAGTAKLIFRG